MPYCQLFYHLVWATKHRQPLLTPAVEAEIYDYIRSKAVGLGGTVFALNGIEEHVHLVAIIPPSVSVSTFVGQVKGVSSACFNKAHPTHEPKFEWQEEYGAFSFDGKRLHNVIAYVKNQKEHHRRQTVIPVLERVEENAQSMVREAEELYRAEEASWRSEMLSLIK